MSGYFQKLGLKEWHLDWDFAPDQLINRIKDALQAKGLSEDTLKTLEELKTETVNKADTMLEKLYDMSPDFTTPSMNYYIGSRLRGKIVKLYQAYLASKPNWIKKTAYTMGLDALTTITIILKIPAVISLRKYVEKKITQGKTDQISRDKTAEKLTEPKNGKGKVAMGKMAKESTGSTMQFSIGKASVTIQYKSK